MFSKRKQIIGIELGSACLKAAVVELIESTNELLVREYAIHPVETTSHDLVTSVGLLLGKLKTKCRDCAIAAWPDSALFRFFEHDPTDATPIRKLLNPESAGTSQAIEDYALDFVDAGPGKQSQKSRTYVACGLPRKEVEATRDLLGQLKYKLKLFQLSPIAVFNAFQFSLEEDATRKPFLSVDLGYKRSSLSGGEAELHLMREIQWGGNDLKSTLVEQQVIAADQPLEELTLASERLTDALREAVPPLAREIQFSLDYLRMEAGSDEVREIHLSGGLSNFTPFVEALQEALGIPLQRWNPFRKMQATSAALKESGLLVDLYRLQAAAGAAIQVLT